MHTVRGTSGNVHDVPEGNRLLHGQETVACENAGYRSIDKHPDANAQVGWHLAMAPGKRRARERNGATLNGFPRYRAI